MKAENHSQFYSKAQYYDIAFQFKNVPVENDTIRSVFNRINGRALQSFLDIAAGPATNALEFAKGGTASTALDFSAEMVAYGLEKAKFQNRPIHYFQADMRDFKITKPVDAAAIFMDSTSYLLTNDDVLQHLDCVAAALNPAGLYFLEMSHPRDVFSVGKSASTTWTEISGDIEVSVQWGSESDVFNPITQITETTATLGYRSPQGEGTITEKASQRCFTHNEFTALVKANGKFEIVEMLGSFKPGIAFDNSEKCWRMIPILRKVP